MAKPRTIQQLVSNITGETFVTHTVTRKPRRKYNYKVNVMEDATLLLATIALLGSILALALVSLH